jgi:uncharacterized protein YunC (DUF1805 family)
MQIKDIVINNKTVRGIEIPLANASMVIITGSKGYLMCGYLDISVAEKFGDCAAVIKGIKTVDDMLAAKVVNVTSSAQKTGIQIGMTGRQALEKLI